MRDWIIDTDCGVDDAQAIILMLNHPNVNVIAITAVAGNCPIEQVIVNVSEIQRICNREDIPIYKGCEIPIIEPFKPATDFHGPDGLGGYWQAKGRTPPIRNDPKEHASSAIVRMTAENPNLNILLLGPLTNMATAYLLNRNLQVQSLVAMGALENPAEDNRPEFNVACDPEAYKIVISSCEKLTIACFELTMRIAETITDEYRHAWLNPQDTEKKQILKFFMDYLISKDSDAVLCDSVAAAIACDESIIQKSQQKFIEIELKDSQKRGMNYVYWDGIEQLGGQLQANVRENVVIVEKINEDAFWSMIVNASNQLNQGFQFLLAF